jgi:hypothetical protein
LESTTKEENPMAERDKTFDRRSWAIGGTTMIGLGIGFIFVRSNVFIFLASLLSGIGAGLVIAAILPGKRG